MALRIAAAFVSIFGLDGRGGRLEGIVSGSVVSFIVVIFVVSGWEAINSDRAVIRRLRAI